MLLEMSEKKIVVGVVCRVPPVLEISSFPQLQTSDFISPGCVEVNSLGEILLFTRTKSDKN